MSANSSTPKMTVQVIGLGYMGLPMASLLASLGVKVVGVDIDKRRVDSLKKGEVYFDEPGLSEVVKKALKAKKISFTTTPETADFHVIAVPTPFMSEAGVADLSYVRAATVSLVNVLKKGDIVILESTVPPGTCDRMLKQILEKSGLRYDQDFFVVHCPERAFPGNTMYELVHNDRIIGGNNGLAVEKVRDLYAQFVQGTIHLTSARTAEMVKLMENTFRDVNIALANEFAQISEEIGINVWEAINLANKHPRVHILLPGPGVGGHCLAVDPLFLNETSSSVDIIKKAREINDEMPIHVSRMVDSFFDPATEVVTILGLAYKPNVDDTRETPAGHLIRILEQKGYEVRRHDFFVKDPAFLTLELEVALEDSDGAILITHHDAYRELDPLKLGKLMRRRQLIDTRNHLDHALWRRAGFRVAVLGNGQQ